MDCIVEIREVYGRESVYPVNETARLLCALAGTKTITFDALDKITRLGYNIVVSHARADAYAAEHLHVANR